MDNSLGNNVKQYRNTVVRSSTIGDNTILADDVFVTDSKLGHYCTIERRGMVFHSTIGDYSYTGYNTVVKYASIGKYCAISWNVSVGGENHDYQRLSIHPFYFMSRYGFESCTGGWYNSAKDPLTIGNDVWIGSNSVILRGVNIGHGAVIGASSVITRDIPPYSIVVGNPGRVIKKRFSDDVIKKLLEINWWDWPRAFIEKHLTWFTKESLTIEDLESMLNEYNQFVNIGR